MTVIARRITSIPVRNSTETWQVICNLLAQPHEKARELLEAAAGVASMLISEEYTTESPIILWGGGPRVRIYTLHGTDAIEPDSAQETPLQFVPTSGDWHLSFPAKDIDVEMAATALADISPRMTARDIEESKNEAITSMRTDDGTPIIRFDELER